MRSFLFEKAKYLKDFVKLVAESDNQIIIQVKEFQVVFKYQNHKLIALCSCKAGSVLQPCAHILSAVAYLTT